MAGSYWIPKNVLGDSNISIRNVMEGVIESFILFLILAFIPFTVQVRWIIWTTSAVFIMIINILGVQGNSIIQGLLAKHKYRKICKKKYSYRRFKNGVKRDNPEIIRNGQVVSIKDNRGIQAFQSFMGR